MITCPHCLSSDVCFVRTGFLTNRIKQWATKDSEVIIDAKDEFNEGTTTPRYCLCFDCEAQFDEFGNTIYEPLEEEALEQSASRLQIPTGCSLQDKILAVLDYYPGGVTLNLLGELLSTDDINSLRLRLDKMFYKNHITKEET